MIFITVIVSFILAVLSGIGVGGGGLFVIYLALFTNTPQLTAQGINLVYFLFSAGASILVHLSKRKIFTSAVALMSATGIAGALAGAFFSGYIDQSLLRKIFGVMLMISGTLSLKTSFSSKYKKIAQSMTEK